MVNHKIRNVIQSLQLVQSFRASSENLSNKNNDKNKVETIGQLQQNNMTQ